MFAHKVATKNNATPDAVYTCRGLRGKQDFDTGSSRGEANLIVVVAVWNGGDFDGLAKKAA